MRPSLSSHALLVVAPVLVAAAAAFALAGSQRAALQLSSAVRLGRVTGALFRGEMAATAGRLTEGARPLPASEVTSSMADVARRGDTVAALGTVSGKLVLSVALPGENPPGREAGESPSPPGVRGATEPFRPRALHLLGSRTGMRSALYFRGNRVLAHPPEFGPSTLEEAFEADAPDAPAPSSDRRSMPISPAPSFLSLDPGPTALLPIASGGETPPPLNLLVTPSPTPAGGTMPWGPPLLLVVSCAGGLLLAWQGRRYGGRLPVLASSALPVAALWIVVLAWSVRAETWVEEAETRDLIRTLALLEASPGEGGEAGLDGKEPDRGKEREGASPEPEGPAGAGGYEMARIRNGTVVSSTLPEETLERLLARLPPPPVAFPVTGELPEPGPGAYGAGGGGEEDLILLFRPERREARVASPMRLGALGGGASLLSLLFLFFARDPGRDHLVRHPE